MLLFFLSTLDYSKSSSNFSSSFRSDFSSSGNKEEEVEESFSESDGDAIFVERYAHKTVKPISIGKEHFSRTRCVVDRAVSPIEEGLRGFMHDAQHNQVRTGLTILIFILATSESSLKQALPHEVVEPLGPNFVCLNI